MMQPTRFSLTYSPLVHMTSDPNGGWVKWEDAEHITIQRDHAIVVVKETMGKMTKQAYDNVEQENALKDTITKLRKRVELLNRAGNELSRRLWLHDFQANSQFIHNWEDAKYGEVK